MFTKRLVGGALALTLFAAACGNNQPTTTPVVGQDGQEAAAAPATGSPAAFLGNTSLGNVLIGPDGRTLYGFTNDSQAASTCYGGCAEAWPPVLVDPNWTIGPGLDLGIFATTVRDDGQLQLVAGKWPLYYYIDDAASGDVNGQGSGDVWFAVNLDGSLVTAGNPGADTDGADNAADSTQDTGAEAAPAQDQDPAADEAATANDEARGDGIGVAAVSTGLTDLGEVLVDVDGLTLYGFTNDSDGLPTCNDGCAEAWPPLLVDELPAELDPELYSVVRRDDGAGQLAIGRWPLYRFAGDAAAGDVNGQGSGGVWFAASPDGSLVGGPGGDDSPSDGSMSETMTEEDGSGESDY